MSRHTVWHESRTFAPLKSAFTSWCGQTVRKRDVDTRWFGSGHVCAACPRARKDSKRGGKR